MKLNRTGSIWDRNNRNGINTNWVRLESFLKEFDGTRLMEVSYNLYNKANAGTGSVNSSDGTVNSDGFRNSGFISILPNTDYVTTTKGSGAFYDGNKTFISSVLSSNTSFKSPPTAAFFRTTLAQSQVETFMIHEGTSLKPYMEYGIKPYPLILAPELRAEIAEAMDIFEDFDSLTINRGKDFPLKSVKLGTNEPVEIPNHVKNVVLDAKVSGAKTDMYYRLDFVANGHVSGGKARYGINISELRIADGTRARHVFLYDADDLSGNYQNANIQKTSDGIDTIIVGNEEIAVSLTVDRAAITNSSNPTYLNLNSGIGNSPSSVIDRSVYTNF